MIKMESFLFLLLIFQFCLIMGLCYAVFFERITTLRYGIRRKTATFIDRRQSVRVTLSENLKTFEFENSLYVWNTDRETNDGCVYVTNNAEALAVSADWTKCTYWCDTNEYHTNLKNTLLQTLMMLRSRDIIITLLMILLIISIAIIAFVWFRTGTIITNTNDIYNQVIALNHTINPHDVIVSEVK